VHKSTWPWRVSNQGRRARLYICFFKILFAVFISPQVSYNKSERQIISSICTIHYTAHCCICIVLRHYFTWQLASLLHSQLFAWRQRSTLFQFTVSQIPNSLIKGTAVNITLLFTLFKKLLEINSFRHADMHHVQQKVCLLHFEVL